MRRLVAALVLAVACEGAVDVTDPTTGAGGAVSSAASSVTSSTTAQGGSGGVGGSCAPPPCHITECQGHIYQCGDCVDNDEDDAVDAMDLDCTGPCDNTEDSYGTNIIPHSGAPCVVDCFFDQDFGSGNDDCYWTHTCDPYEVAPHYYPEPWNGTACEYDPDVMIRGANASCAELHAAQSPECLDYCGPLTPNGCDCFGCCELPAGSDNWVWLDSGKESADKCTVAVAADPERCHPCTPVPGCLNACEACELCLGKSELELGCEVSSCPEDRQPCGLPCQEGCPEGEYCITGCCVPTPR